MNTSTETTLKNDLNSITKDESESNMINHSNITNHNDKNPTNLKSEGYANISDCLNSKYQQFMPLSLSASQNVTSQKEVSFFSTCICMFFCSMCVLHWYHFV